MKVVHIATCDFWGSGASTYRLHKALQNKGIKSLMLTLVKTCGDPSVKMVVLDPISKKDVYIVEKTLPNTETISNIMINKWKDILEIDPLLGDIQFEFSLWDSIIDIGELPPIKDADVVHVHMASSFFDFETAPFYLMGKPVVFTFYDSNGFTGGCHFPRDCDGYKRGCFDCPFVKNKEVVKNCYEKKKRCYELLNPFIVFTSSFLADKALESDIFYNLERNINIIPPGIIIDENKIDKKKIKEHLMIPFNRPVIMFCAFSLTNQKNRISDFINSFSYLKDLNPYVIIIGNGSAKIEVGKELEVLLIEFIPHEEILKWYFKASDLFISLETEEKIPIRVLEAMSCGLPVVGYNEGGILEVVAHKKTGYLAKKGDLKDLADGIKWVLNNKRSLSKNVKKVIKEKFNLEKVADAYIKLYEKAIKEKGKFNRDKYLKWGEELFLNKNLDFALRIFDKLLQINENDAEVLNNIGVIYWEKGMLNKAFEFFKKAYSIFPDSKEIKDNYIKSLKIIKNK